MYILYTCNEFKNLYLQICDLNMRILNINARYPGSTHDSHIWDGSKVLPVIKQLNSQDNKTWLLGIIT